MKIEDHLHEQKVEDIHKQMVAFHKTGQQIRVYRGETNTTRSVAKNRQKAVDVSSLTKILVIDTIEKFVIVEPNVPLDSLVKATIPLGLMPPVVSEFPGITIGGAVQGGAAESSSWNWGCLHESVIDYEVVLGTGSIKRVSSNLNPDLYHGLACSYGSLGIVTAIKLKLIEAPEYVELDYILVNNTREALAVMASAKKISPLFIDAIMFNAAEGVVMVGNRTNDSTLPLSQFRRARDEWFYLHAHKIISKHKKYKERIPIQDYLFRYDRGAFWMGKHGYSLFHIPFNRFSRFWFAGLMKTRTLYRFLHAANLSQKYIIQDICLPVNNIEEFIDYVNKELGIQPLWLCPIKQDKNAWLAPNYLASKEIVNIGLWGEFDGDYSSFIDANLKIEKMVHRLGGRKVLYAHSYYQKNDFWAIYNKEQYTTLRKRHQADRSLKNIYDKVIVRHRYRVSLLRGWLAILKDFVH